MQHTYAVVGAGLKHIYEKITETKYNLKLQMIKVQNFMSDGMIKFLKTFSK